MVMKWGAPGLILSSLFLIPFDYVMRCIFHETWKGRELIFKFGALILISSVATFLINFDTFWIAVASAVGFIAAQIAAGIFYQSFIKRSFFLKVNGSDFVAIVVDSIIFQLIAFGMMNWWVMSGQIILKIFGGLFWFWIIFTKLKLGEKIKKNNEKNINENI
jgi:uncharacterized PurR-regulated membrane protein YhhQ (DUF165 family)